MEVVGWGWGGERGGWGLLMRGGGSDIFGDLLGRG